MSDPQKRRSPRQSARSPRAINQHQGQHYNRQPPFAKALNPDRLTLFVLAGSESWSWGRNDSWMPGAKLVLPPGDHPSAYRWNCAQSFVDAVIVAAGHPPTFDVITALAAELLVYVDLVVYLDNRGQAVRLNPARRAA